MDLSELNKLEQQIGKLKLSEAIRKGAEFVEEMHHSHRGCALGTASFGLTGKRLAENVHSYDNDDNGYSTYHHFIAKLTDTPVEIVRQTEWNHLSSWENMSRLEIADWLQAQGY